MKTLAQWIRSQPDAVPGGVMPERLRFLTASDFNQLKKDLNEPQLGLASIQELLVELQARGLVGRTSGAGSQGDYSHLEADADHLLKCLSKEVLEQRTWKVL